MRSSLALNNSEKQFSFISQLQIFTSASRLQPSLYERVHGRVSPIASHGRCQLEDSIGTGNGPNGDIENEEIDRQLLYSAM